jgi:hypothetical protein
LPLWNDLLRLVHMSLEDFWNLCKYEFLFDHELINWRIEYGQIDTYSRMYCLIFRTRSINLPSVGSEEFFFRNSITCSNSFH